jgi:hypothetical protein
VPGVRTRTGEAAEDSSRMRDARWWPPLAAD